MPCCAVPRRAAPCPMAQAVPTDPFSPQEHGLDFQRLLDASAYKETYRQDMIRWGEEKRCADPGFFCRTAVEGAAQPVWVSGGGHTGVAGGAGWVLTEPPLRRW